MSMVFGKILEVFFIKWYEFLPQKRVQKFLTDFALKSFYSNYMTFSLTLGLVEL